MLKKWIQKLRDNNMVLDMANVILGVVLLIALVLVFTIESSLALLLAVWSAGLMNTVNGLKAMKHRERKTAGQSMVFMGLLIVFGGTILVFSMMGIF